MDSFPPRCERRMFTCGRNALLRDRDRFLNLRLFLEYRRHAVFARRGGIDAIRSGCVLWLEGRLIPMGLGCLDRGFDNLVMLQERTFCRWSLYRTAFSNRFGAMRLGSRSLRSMLTIDLCGILPDLLLSVRSRWGELLFGPRLPGWLGNMPGVLDYFRRSGNRRCAGRGSLAAVARKRFARQLRAAIPSRNYLH